MATTTITIYSDTAKLLEDKARANYMTVADLLELISDRLFVDKVRIIDDDIVKTL